MKENNAPAGKIIATSIVNEMADAYTSFAIATLNRALPSAIDGLKISQRRILQTAFEKGFTSDKQAVKLARLSGEVMASYHPHSATDDASCNLGNKANYQHPLLFIQGNNGGVTEAGLRTSDDNHASARYLEVKLTKFAEQVYFADGSWKFCEFKPNYDSTRKEIIEFIPALPMALLNATSGMTAGYATSIASYNLQEIAKYAAGRKAYPLPDNASCANIASDEGLTNAADGHGTIRMIGDYECIANKITVTSLPLVSAEKFCSQIKANIDKFPDVRHVHDLSSRKGILVEIIVKKGRQASATLPLLLQHTGLSDTLSINNTLLCNGLPKQLSIANIYQGWHSARVKVLSAMFANKIAEFENTLLMQSALLVCLKNKPAFMKAVLDSDDAELALQSTFQLSAEQCRYILSKPLRSITKLEQGKLLSYIEELKLEKAEAEANLNDVPSFIVKQVQQLAKEFGVKRQCKIIASSAVPSIAKPSKPARSAKPAKQATLPEELLQKARGAGLSWTMRRINSIAKNYNANKYGLKTKYKTVKECIEAHIAEELK